MDGELEMGQTGADRDARSGSDNDGEAKSSSCPVVTAGG